MTDRHATTCDLCGKPLRITEYGVHQYTSGWVKLREDGGGHGVSCPVRVPRWAHKLCVERAAKGQLSQTSLTLGR
jgi:hypothetical protein